MKKGVIFLTSILLMAACNTDSTEETLTDEQNEPETSTTEVEETADDT